MRIIVTFLLNAGLNFAVGLVLASMLGPDRYGQFAVGFTAATVIATGVFDWLRLSATRFYGDAQQKADPGIRRTLDRAFLCLVTLLAAIAGALMLLPLGFAASLVGAVALMAVANGVFDYQTALARARFLDAPYAAMVIGKGVFGLALACGAGLLGRDPALVLAAQAAGALIVILPVAPRLRDRPVGGSRPDRTRLGSFARYGVPIVAANVLFQAIALLTRSMAAATLGYASAGHLSLATDVELRLLLASGAAIDVLVFQLAVRSESQGGPAAAEIQLRSNMVVVAAALGLIATGFAVTLPSFVALVVPARYQDGFAALALTLLPGMVLFCLGQFALNPVLQMRHRTTPIIVAAAISAASVGVGVLFCRGHLDLLGFATLHATGLAVGFAVLAGIVLRDRAMRPRWRDLLGIALAAGFTAVGLWPLRAVGSPLMSLALSAVVGPIAYAAVLLACDVGPFRALARPLLARITGRRATQRLA